VAEAVGGEQHATEGFTLKKSVRGSHGFRCLCCEHGDLGTRRVLRRQLTQLDFQQPGRISGLGVVLPLSTDSRSSAIW
jgi:hypothetical protein